MLSVIVTVFPGRLAHGVMLAANQDSMRVALKGSADTVELRRVEGRWIADGKHPVEFEVLLTDGHSELDVFQEAPPMVMAVGRG